MTYEIEDRLAGCLLGTAVGDALGLPFEGLSPKRRERMFGPVSGYRLIGGRGMVSDDTEHACMTAQCLIESPDDPLLFSRALARRLRGWFILLPAGVGFATLRACLRLCAGISADRSGVVSAGNGPAMRTPIIGATLGADSERLGPFVEACTCITHRDRKAYCGAYAAALAVAWAAENRDPKLFAATLEERISNEPASAQLTERVRAAWESASAGHSTSAFVVQLGLSKGVSGYIYDTVPVAIHSWMRYPDDFTKAVTETIECGGDADSTGALSGALLGAQVGASNIPAHYLQGIIEYPRTVEWVRSLGTALATARDSVPSRAAPRLNPVLLLARNLLFIMIVLTHGFRRIAPPYG